MVADLLAAAFGRFGQPLIAGVRQPSQARRASNPGHDPEAMLQVGVKPGEAWAVSNPRRAQGSRGSIGKTALASAPGQGFESSNCSILFTSDSPSADEACRLIPR